MNAVGSLDRWPRCSGCGGVWLVADGARPAAAVARQDVDPLRRDRRTRRIGPVDGWARVGRSPAPSRADASRRVADLRLTRRTQEVHAAYLAAAAVGGPLRTVAAVGDRSGDSGCCRSACRPAAGRRAHRRGRRAACRALIDALGRGRSNDTICATSSPHISTSSRCCSPATSATRGRFDKPRRPVTVASSSNCAGGSSSPRHRIVRSSRRSRNSADDLDLVELQQISASASLAASAGAPVAKSLAAKCATLAQRARQPSRRPTPGFAPERSPFRSSACRC